MPEEDNTTVVARPIETEMRTSYIDYSMSVIVGRALPDARDGLKPVHRRVLYAMQDMGFTSDKPYKKSARIVGEVLGKYHPHGDTACYDTLVRMAQPFSLRYPLIDGQGNFGSVDGDSAAAMRYTEARLSPIASELLEDLDKETVDFRDNFDASLKEPVVVPGKLPNLLVNGSTGIAVGMATNVPPHQLGEIVDAIQAFIRDPDVTLQDLMQIVPGPDFPTGGIIHGRQGIYDAYGAGRGTIRVRAKARIEEDDATNKSRIIVTEIPYMVNKANLIISIADLVKEKRVEDISDIRDESDRDGMRIVIELKRGAVADVVLNNLFKHTQLESTFGIQMLALVDGQPVNLGLKGLIEQYVLHRTEVVTRRTQYLLRKAEDRLHIVKGLLLAVANRDNLDTIIRIIRGSEDTEAAKAALVAHDWASVDIEYVDARLDEVQAKAILDMRLGRLTGLEVQKLRGEGDELFAKIVDYKDILAKPERVKAIIVEELDDLKAKYNDERRTEIVEDLGALETEDLIPDEPVVITLTNAGYIKRIGLDEYRVQGRGGKGLIGLQTKDGDFVQTVFTTTTHKQLLFFTNRGRVHWLKTWRIPEGTRQSKGKAIVNLLEGLEADERIQTVIPIGEFADGYFLFFATKNGTVKKTPLTAYSRPRVTGIIALGLDEGDELVHADVTDGERHVVLAKANGKSIRFPESDVRSMGRPATGVRGVTLDAGDQVVSMCVIRNPDGHLLTITENGYGKRTEAKEYRVQGRGGNGIITIQTTARNGRVVAVREVAPDQELMVTSYRGMMIRIPVESVSTLGRNTQGNRIMRLDEEDRVIGVTVLEKEEDAPAEAPDALPEDADARSITPDEPGASDE